MKNGELLVFMEAAEDFMEQCMDVHTGTHTHTHTHTHTFMRQESHTICCGSTTSTRGSFRATSRILLMLKP